MRSAHRANVRPLPSLLDIAQYFLILGATGFGGPIALANYMRTDLVETRRWIGEAEYDEGLAIATACPGPLAYQLGIYCGYILRGIPGAIVAAVSFATAPFIVVCAAAWLYVRFSGAWETRALFYGIAPVVLALIVKACWSLGRKTLGGDRAAWVFFAVSFVLTLAFQRELAPLFLTSGAVGIVVFGRSDAKRAGENLHAGKMRTVSLPILAAALVSGFVGAGTVISLFLFFFKTGLFVFGSGLVIVPFLKAYVVDQYRWLSNRQFLDAVAVGMISPGPVVITATFVGFLLKGVMGAFAATVGIFLPPFGFTVLATPLLRKYRSNARVRGFLRGVTVTVVGVLAGTVYFVGRSAVGDVVTAVLAIGSLLLATRGRLPDQALVGLGAAAGLAAYPLVRPEWVLR